MTNFVILHSTANLVDSFDNEAEGRAALEKIAREDPDAADEYALLAYDDTGHPVGDAIVAADLAHVI